MKYDTLKKLVENCVREVMNEEKGYVFEVTLDSETKPIEEKKGDSATLNQKRAQVTTMMNQDKIDLAALGRKLYPNMDDDTSRSYISKKARGERELTSKEVNKLYDILHSNKGDAIR